MKSSSKPIIYIISLVFVLLASGACSANNQILAKNSSEFVIQDNCVSLSNHDNTDINIQGVIWYEEDSILYPGSFGLQFIGNSRQDKGILPVNPIQMIISPGGNEALFDGYEAGVDILNSRVYRLTDHEYQTTELEWRWNSPIWADNNLLLGTSWDFENGTITVVTTDLKTGISKQTSVADRGMSSEPAPKIARNGILTYLWYSNFEGPRLVVYDTNTNKEIARYKDISYIMRPSWFGYLLNPQGTHILSISSLVGEGYDGKQQELFGVEIGKEPVQITDFHSKYPYALIYDINFGGQTWSPDNRWIVLNVLPSETGQFDSSIDPSWLFLIDLEKNVGYQICQQINPNDQHSMTWSPDSRHFALSINDKVWVVDPKTLESRLLVKRPGVPLRVLGWTIP